MITTARVSKKPRAVQRLPVPSMVSQEIPHVGVNVYPGVPTPMLLNPMAQYADGPNLYQYTTSDPISNTDPSGLAEYCGKVTCHCHVNDPSSDVTVPVYGCSLRAKIVLFVGYRSGGCFVPPPAREVDCTMPCEDIDLEWFLPHECCHVCAWQRGIGEWTFSWTPGDLMTPKYCDTYKVNYTFKKE